MPTALINLVRLEQVAERSPALTRRTLRYWLHYNLDGFRDACAVKIGGKILLDLSAVERWIEGHKAQAENQQAS